MTSAPIVLFVYDRPNHTQRTLKALAANSLAEDSILYVYADGPKPEADTLTRENIWQTRQLLRQQDWCKEVRIIEADQNKGLADSIVEGVTSVVNEYGKVIVLEDDIVTSPGFLQYMNEALNLYENEDKVMHVSGYMFPVNETLPSTFFYDTASCWGWGTWRRAWKHYNHNAQYLLKTITERNEIHRFDIEGTHEFSRQLRRNVEGQLKTWAVRWYASFFLEHGHALHPYPSLVNNIGNDGSGVNSGKYDVYDWKYLANRIEVKPIPVAAHKQARRAMRKFYRNHSRIKGVSKTKALMSAILSPQTKRWLKKIVSSRYRVVHREQQRLLGLPRYTRTSTSFLGRKIIIPDAASYLFMKKEIFQREIYKFKTDTEAPYILDCGANVGLSIIYFKRLFPKSRIVGFEPDEEIFSILERNLRTYELTGVELKQQAVWSSETTLKFLVEGADGGRVASDWDDSALKEIKATRLKEYLNRTIDFLKIDIEGAETEIVIDCAEHLRFVKNMFIEYHSFVGQAQSLSEILAIVRNAGFRYYIDAPGFRTRQPFVRSYETSGMDMQLNIYCIR